MTNGPLPPHERPWRHPSELAGPAPEPATRSGRLLIGATATVSLLLVGGLALLMMPRRAPQATDAIVTTSFLAIGGPAAPLSIVGTFDTPAAPNAAAGVATSVLDPRTGERAGERAAGGAQEIDRTTSVPPPPATSSAAVLASTAAPLTVTTTGTPSALASPFADADPNVGTSPGVDADANANAEATGSMAPLSLPSSALAMAGSVVVTPLGAELAVTTQSALGGASGPIDAIVPSGDRVVAQAVSSSGGVAFVVIVDGAPANTMSVAAVSSGDTEMFLALGDTAIPVDASSLVGAAVPEGAPVVNGDGALVGLCTNGPNGVEVLPIGSVPDLSEQPVDSASAASPSPTTPVTTAGPTLPGAPTAPTTVAVPPATTTTVAAPAPAAPPSSDTAP